MFNGPKSQMVRFYFGTDKAADGTPLTYTEKRALTKFKATVSELCGGYTEFAARGASVECPEGEATLVVETLLPDNAALAARLAAATLECKEAMRQGSVLVTVHEVAAAFV